MTQLPHNWVKIRSSSLWRVFWSSPTRPGGRSYLLVVVGIQVVLQFGMRFVQDRFGDAAAWIAVGCFLIAVVAAALVSAARSLTPSINVDDSLVKVGRKTFRFDEITDATFLTLQHRSGPSGYLQFGTGGLPAAVMCVRSNRETVLSPGDRELVAEVLRRSAVRVPENKVDRFDPTGRFGWLDHPNHLTVDEAIEYVLHTPASGEPVHEKPPRKSIWIDED